MCSAVDSKNRLYYSQARNSKEPLERRQQRQERKIRAFSFSLG